jgi:enoyl-CoA hydratase/carnithine racemase
MGDASQVVYEPDGPMAVIRLDRAEKLNAFTFAMITALRERVDQAVADETVVAIVFTGTGRAFSAGLDAEDLARSTQGGPPARPSRADPDAEPPALFSYLLGVPKPVIAAVNGVCAGGGLVLAMMSDLRFVAASATFTTVFSRRGLIAEHATSWLLPRMIGTNRALDLLWSSRRFDAAEALRLGFADRVVPDDDLLAEVRRYVEDLAASVSPQSLATMKAQVYEGLSQTFDEAVWDADARMRVSLDHPDAREGVASFAERRPPRFLPWSAGGP